MKAKVNAKKYLACAKGHLQLFHRKQRRAHACSLNLILGYGGLVSFGHAAYLGVGAYTVGILISEGFTNAWLGFALAMSFP